MNQEGLENFVNNIIDELKKERERLLDNFTQQKLEAIRKAMKKYKATEIKKDIKGEEPDYVYFKKAKVGLELLTKEQWEECFKWIGGAFHHNTNMDLRIGTNDLETEFKDDHLEICATDIDEIVEEEFIDPACKYLKERKRQTLRKLIALSQEPNKFTKGGNQFEAVKNWLYYFGVRPSVCATELIYGIAAIFSGVEKEQKPRDTEMLSIYKNFQVWVKQIAKLRPDITSQRSVYKNYEKSQNSGTTFTGIKSTINENLAEEFILKNSKIKKAQKKSIPFHFQHNLLRTWQADQRRLGAWRRISPLDHQEISDLRTTIHFCFSPLMFDEVEMLFNYKHKNNDQKLYAMDCSSVNDAKIKLISGKHYQLSDGDVIEAVTLNKDGGEQKSQKLIVSIFKTSFENKEAVNFRELQQQTANFQQYFEVYGLTDYDDPEGENAKFEDHQDGFLGQDIFPKLSGDHFEIKIVEEEKEDDGHEEDLVQDVEKKRCVLLSPSEQTDLITYFYMKKVDEMRNAEASTQCSSIKNFEISLQNRFIREWKTSFKIQ